MGMRRTVSKIVLAVVLASSVVPFGSFAVEQPKVSDTLNQTITLEKAIQLAKENSYQIRQIASAKDKAMKAYSATDNAGAKIGNMLDEYYNYQNLFEKGAKTLQEKNMLQMYSAMFDGAPSLNFEQLYDRYVIPKEVTPYQVYVQFQSLKLDEPTVASLVEYQTSQLFYNILSYQHQSLLMQDSIKISKKTLDELELKYKVGQVAKATLDSEKIKYEKSQRSLVVLKNNLKVMETQFNGLIGRPLNAMVSLVDPGLKKSEKVIDYSQLVDEAMKNRVDLKKKQLELDALNHEVEVMTKYLRNSNLDRLADVDQRLLTEKLSKLTLEGKIKSDILATYGSYKQSEEQLSISKKKVDLSEKQLSKIKQMYTVGYAKSLDVFSLELQLQNSKLAYESAVYNYNIQLDAMKRITIHALN